MPHYYYIVGVGVDVPLCQRTRDNFDGTQKIVRVGSERPELGDALTHEEALTETGTEVWEGPHPDA
jgi:hypothetical protein